MGLETEPAKPEPQMGSLYSLDKKRALKKHLDKIDISNGLAWSLDNKIMYYIDSLPRKVYAFDFDLEAGTISKSTFLEMPNSSDFIWVICLAFVMVQEKNASHSLVTNQVWQTAILVVDKANQVRQTAILVVDKLGEYC